MGSARQDWVGCGVACEQCGKDEWFPFQGFNRCACGQELWVERAKDDAGGTRFRHRQAATVPPGYGGWLKATE